MSPTFFPRSHFWNLGHCGSSVVSEIPQEDQVESSKRYLSDINLLQREKCFGGIPYKIRNKIRKKCQKILREELRTGVQVYKNLPELTLWEIPEETLETFGEKDLLLRSLKEYRQALIP